MSLQDGEFKHAPRADAHGPIGVMGEHRHHQGELMLSYRYMRMQMEGNLIGEDSVTPEQIVTTVPNRFFGQPMQPPTLRVVPTEMSADMQMFGAMYGLTDRVTLMAMLPYIDKNMDHITFKGPVGTTRLGRFTTDTDGVGDFSFGGLIGLYDQRRRTENSISICCSVERANRLHYRNGPHLTPMGGTRSSAVPMPCSGSGTWDFLPGIVYTALWKRVLRWTYRGALSE